MNQETRDKMAALVAGNKPAAPAAKKPVAFELKPLTKAISIPHTSDLNYPAGQNPYKDERLKAIRGAVAEVQKERIEEQILMTPQAPPTTGNVLADQIIFGDREPEPDIKMPSIADFSGNSILDGIVKNLAVQLEYQKAMAEYWRKMYDSIKK